MPDFSGPAFWLQFESGIGGVEAEVLGCRARLRVVYLRQREQLHHMVKNAASTADVLVRSKLHLTVIAFLLPAPVLSSNIQDTDTRGSCGSCSPLWQSPMEARLCAHCHVCSLQAAQALSQ
jgi:hypothetical protein